MDAAQKKDNPKVVNCSQDQNYALSGEVFVDVDGYQGSTKEFIAEPNMGVSVYSTPVAKDGVLYVLGRNRLFALELGASGKPSTRSRAGGH